MEAALAEDGVADEQYDQRTAQVLTERIDRQWQADSRCTRTQGPPQVVIG